MTDKEKSEELAELSRTYMLLHIGTLSCLSGYDEEKEETDKAAFGMIWDDLTMECQLLLSSQLLAAASNLMMKYYIGMKKGLDKTEFKEMQEPLIELFEQHLKKHNLN